MLAANEIQDVHDHQATMKPKNLEYFGPAASAAQMYIEPLNGNAEHTSARTAAVISINTTVIKYDDHIAAGPPASNPKKNVDLTLSMKFKVMKLAAKLSIKLQRRRNRYAVKKVSE